MILVLIQLIPWWIFQCLELIEAAHWTMKCCRKQNNQSERTGKYVLYNMKDVQGLSREYQDIS